MTMCAVLVLRGGSRAGTVERVPEVEGAGREL
jgi:hypothetical protein